MSQVELCDVTLREGEQAPGCAFSTDDKLELFHLLDDVGTDLVQVSLPGLDRERLAEAAAICGERRRCRTEIMTNGQGNLWLQQVTAACECGSDIVHTLVDVGAVNGSIEHCKVRLERICHVIHGYRRECSISLIGAFDADRGILLELAQFASSVAERLRIADTYGMASPREVEELLRSVTDACQCKDTKVGFHGHNDMGLAAANMLAAVQAGADFVDASVNGLGSRAGNLDLTQAAFILDRVCGARPPAQLEKLSVLARRTAQVSGIPLPSNTPLVGKHIFDEEIDIHALEILNELPPRGLDPALAGAVPRVLYGKLTTTEVIRRTAQRAGREIPQEYYPEILHTLKAFSMAHRGETLDETGFWRIVNEITAPHDCGVFGRTPTT